jgi:hypothetical protein
MTIQAFFISPSIATKEANSILVAPLGVYSRAGKALVLDSEWCWICMEFYSPRSSVNIPWPEKGMTDADYIHAFQKIVMPIAMEFAPELVISTLRSSRLTRYG